MNIGVTGTRQGLSAAQVLVVTRALVWFKQMLPREAHFLHHGDAKGVDVQVAELARGFGYSVLCYPSDHKDRAHFPFNDWTAPVKPPLDRNRDIVHASSLLLAFPAQADEQFRGSGTWAAIRYARKWGSCDMLVVFPDGRRSVFWGSHERDTAVDYYLSAYGDATSRASGTATRD